MQKKLEKSIIEEGVVLEEEEHTIIEETYEKCREENPFTENSPQALLWQQQKIQAGLKDRRSMKWHPLIVRWCISLYLKSPSVIFVQHCFYIYLAKIMFKNISTLLTQAVAFTKM